MRFLYNFGKGNWFTHRGGGRLHPPAAIGGVAQPTNGATWQSPLEQCLLEQLLGLLKAAAGHDVKCAFFSL